MSILIKTAHAGVIAAFACLCNAHAADVDAASASAVSPGYIGADVGVVVYDGNARALTRVYGGLTMGSTAAFGLQQVHALELMAYTTKLRGDDDNAYPRYVYPGADIRANGVALSWTSATKLDESWSLTSRLGATFTHAKTSYGGDNLYGSYRFRHNSAGVIAGVGAAYKISPNLSATVDMTYMPIKVDSYSKTDAATVSVGLKHQF